MTSAFYDEFLIWYHFDISLTKIIVIRISSEWTIDTYEYRIAFG